jgi:hypothetical protein
LPSHSRPETGAGSSTTAESRYPPSAPPTCETSRTTSLHTRLVPRQPMKGCWSHAETGPWVTLSILRTIGSSTITALPDPTRPRTRRWSFP